MSQRPGSENFNVMRPAELEFFPSEPPLEPDIPIVDCAHHLWFFSEPRLAWARSLTSDPITQSLVPVFEKRARYLLDEYLTDIERSGHNVVASVYVNALSMYRAQGPEPMKAVGEVEFANGVAAMSASETLCRSKVCAGIVAAMPKGEPEVVEQVLNAYVRAGGDRFRGVRAHLLEEGHSYLKHHRNTIKTVHKLGLSLDVIAIEPRLREVWQLAQAFPDTAIILNHVGLPLGIGRYKGKRDERFPLWLNEIRKLSRCANAVVKLGGLGMPIAGLPSFRSPVPATSEQLAEEWKPYIQTCVEKFGPDRCMFESDFPADSLTCSYSTMWNTFKLLTSTGSPDEKRSLFHDTAQRVYKLSLGEVAPANSTARSSHPMRVDSESETIQREAAHRGPYGG